MRPLLPALLPALLVASGCASPPRVPPSRESPEAMVELFKVMDRKQDWGGQWDLLSPGLKQRLSRRAGRNVDPADYASARNAYRNDPMVRTAEQLLQTAQVRRVQPDGPNAAYVVVQALRPVGKSARIRMVKMDRWELYTAGDPEPYWGITGDPLMTVERMADGGYAVLTRASAAGEWKRMDFPSDQVERFATSSVWYIDDLGGLEAEIVGAPPG
jgi:hypothetical protein